MRGEIGLRLCLGIIAEVSVEARGKFSSFEYFTKLSSSLQATTSSITGSFSPLTAKAALDKIIKPPNKFTSV
jgi:hypothetical protein